MTGNLALEVRGLCRSFGGVQAVVDVSFDVEARTVTAMVGPNGAGKTTVFNLLTNFYRPIAGTMRLFGMDLHARSPSEIARLGMVRTFQTARVFPGMSVLENVLAGAHTQVRSSGWLQALGVPAVGREERALRARALELLAALGIVDQYERPGPELPVGKQKLLELARALMSSPRLVLLDEPAAGLNDTETAGLAETLLALRDMGLTIVLVEHNMALVMDIADEVIVLDAGAVIARGTPTEVRGDRRVIEAYLGRAPEA